MRETVVDGAAAKGNKRPAQESLKLRKLVEIPPFYRPAAFRWAPWDARRHAAGGAHYQTHLAKSPLMFAAATGRPDTRRGRAFRLRRRGVGGVGGAPGTKARRLSQRPAKCGDEYRDGWVGPSIYHRPRMVRKAPRMGANSEGRRSYGEFVKKRPFRRHEFTACSTGSR